MAQERCTQQSLAIQIWATTNTCVLNAKARRKFHNTHPRSKNKGALGDFGSPSLYTPHANSRISGILRQIREHLHECLPVIGGSPSRARIMGFVASFQNNTNFANFAEQSGERCGRRDCCCEMFQRRSYDVRRSRAVGSCWQLVATPGGGFGGILAEQRCLQLSTGRRTMCYARSLVKTRLLCMLAPAVHRTSNSTSNSPLFWNIVPRFSSNYEHFRVLFWKYTLESVFQKLFQKLLTPRPLYSFPNIFWYFSTTVVFTVAVKT